MKNFFLLATLFVLSVAKINAQDLKVEFADPSGTTVTECDCKSTGDKAYAVKIWLPQSTFMYDQVTIHFNQPKYADFFSPRSFSGKQLQAQCSGKGYASIELYPCGSYDKKDFTLSVKVKGAMITSYKEELKGNEIIKTPIYGSPDVIGTSSSTTTVHVDAAAAKKRMGKMWILSGVVCGGLLILLLVNNKNEN